MIDPELQGYLSGINQHLVEIKAKKAPGIWRSFFNGMFGAFGYVVGIIIFVVIIGWVLNITGLLGPFEAQWQRFQNFMNKAENVFNATQNQQGSAPTAGSVYTLPDGRKVQVVPVQ